MVTTKYMKEALGNGMRGVSRYSHRPKLWVGEALGAAGLVTGVAGSLIGGSMSSKAAKRAAARQRAQEAREEAWYNRRYNEDYLDTKAGQNLVRRAKEFAQESWKRAAGAKAVAGGTDAAAAQAKEAGNKMVADTIGNIAATDAERKAQVDSQHRQAQEKFMQMDMQREMAKAQNITTAAQGLSNSLMSAGAALSSPNLSGGSNKSKPVTTANENSVPTSTPSNTPIDGDVFAVDGMGNSIYSKRDFVGV